MNSALHVATTHQPCHPHPTSPVATTTSALSLYIQEESGTVWEKSMHTHAEFTMNGTLTTRGGRWRCAVAVCLCRRYVRPPLQACRQLCWHWRVKRQVARRETRKLFVRCVEHFLQALRPDFLRRFLKASTFASLFFFCVSGSLSCKHAQR